MTSNIDPSLVNPTYPVPVTPTTQSVRDNFTGDVTNWTEAKAEITALQAGGFPDISGTGLVAITVAHTAAVTRTMAAPAAGLTIANPGGVAGNPTFALANDLAALEALSGTGIAVRTATDTWAQRTLTGTAAEITVTNGDGVSGAPTLSLPTALTFTGKTVTGGTFASPTLTAPALGTPASGVATNLTGTAAGLTAGNVTTNANLTGVITSVGNTTSIASQTGTGTKFVVDTSPTLVTPAIGVATATSLAIGGATIGTNGLAVTGHLLLEGVTSTGATGTGNLVFSASPTFTGTVTHPTPFTLGAVSVTTTGTQLNYLNAATGTTGTTSTNVVFSTSPTLTTPNIGAATGTSLSVSGQLTSTVSTGTAPLVVSSTTQVSNLNVSQLVGATWASPLAIGTGTPAAGTFTTVTANTSVTTPTVTTASGSMVLQGAGTTALTLTGADAAFARGLSVGTSTMETQGGLIVSSSLSLLAAVANSIGLDPNGGQGNIRSFGADTSTNGAFNFISQRSGGSNSTTLMTMTGAGAVAFPNVGTTASAANAFLDNAASNNLLRSTSSRKYKAGFTPLSLAEIREMARGIVPGRYFSCSPADDPREAHIGVIAEDAAPHARLLVGFDRSGDPDWFKYDRTGPLAFPWLFDHEDRITALERRLAA